MFDFRKILRKKIKIFFSHVWFHMETMIENQIGLKLVINLYIIKLFDFYIIE